MKKTKKFKPKNTKPKQGNSSQRLPHLLRITTTTLTILLTLLKQIIPVGVIDSNVTLPITNTLANVKEYADYTFHFNLTTKLLQGGYIQVIFPNQFESGLGIPLLPNCTVTCNRFERTVDFYFAFDLFPTVVYNMTIRNIKNPDSTGGTGQFVFKSKRGNNILDESLIMGILGFGGGIQDLSSTTVAVDSTTGAQAGEISKYVFSFKTNMFLYSTIYVKLFLPKGAFDVSPNPSCSAFEIKGVLVPGNFTCTYSKEFDSIEVRGFTENIQEGGEVGLSVSMRNPQYSYTTDPFNIVVFKEGTTLAYTRKLNINGVPIIAGKVSQITIEPLDSFFIVSKQKLMWYRLSFKLTNPLVAGSIISIRIPDTITLTTNYVLGQPDSFYVERGIDDISDASPMTITYHALASGKFIKIKNFKPQSQPQKMSVIILITLPGSSGPSLPFEIRSFRSDQEKNEIDKDVSQARITVSDFSRPDASAPGVVSSVTVADGTSTTDLTFTVKPTKTINRYGTIKLLLDANLDALGVAVTNCQVWLKNVAQFTNAETCTKRDRDIYIKLSNQEYTLGIATQFKLNGVVKSPSLAGKYYIEVQTISPEGSILESYTEVLTFTATPLQNYKVEPFPKWRHEAGVHEISFQSPYKVPASRVQDKATDLVSFLQIQYSTTDPAKIKTDLGMGITGSKSIPCKSITGLTPITGYNINCTLIAGVSPKIEIRNYQEFSAGSKILIYIPNIENPDGTWKATTRVVTKQNRIYKEISSADFSYNSVQTTQSMGNIVQTILPADGGTSVSQQGVGTDFNIFNPPYYASELDPYTRILFKFRTYDTGFVPPEGHSTCRIDNEPWNCYQFQGLDWIYGKLDGMNGAKLTVKVETKTQQASTLYINNLRWPRYKPAPSADPSYEMGILETNYIWQKIIRYPAFPEPTVNPFISCTLNVDKKRRQAVDSTYTFTFIPTDPVPEGGTVILTLPTAYNMIASFPRVQILYPEFFDRAANAKLSHTFTSNTITISNMAEHPEKVAFRIIIKGMRNPEIATPLSGFSIQVKLNGFQINEQLNFLSVTLGAAFTPGVVLSNSISLFPTNQLVYADYTFAFTPETKLSVGSEIHIVFPSEYVSLPQTPDCVISGGLLTFESCEKLANDIVIKLDTEYITDTIYFTVKKIQNPAVTTSNEFKIYTFYDGSQVDNTDTTPVAQRKVTFSLPASLISIRQFYFDPVNEGEIATYLMSFRPTNNIAQGMVIYIKFPDTFDQRLGKKPEVFITAGLKGDIQTVIRERTIIISNFNNYQVTDDPITVQVIGVVNPNKPLVGHSGYISIGALKPDNNRYEDFLEQAAVVETVPAPQWLVVHNITTSSNEARNPANYVINLTITDSVPKSDYQGKIYVDLPEQFELGSGFKKCKNLTANLGVNIRCTLDKRTIIMNEHVGVLTSKTAFEVEGILSPLEEVTTNTFFVKTYDGFKREIIQRSFENLDPFKFTYKFPGPLIIVNEDKPIYVERGAQSKDLYLVCTEIMALNLEFFPATPGFNFVPSPLKMGIGEKRTKFRVSVPMGFPDGKYYVNWQTKNELTPPLYTPIRKTKVIITKRGNIPLQLQDINDIPLHGTSLPITFFTEYAPDIGIEILVSLEKNYAGLALDKPSINFESGMNSGTFQVYFTNTTITEKDTVQSGNVNLELIGVNKDIFNLPKRTLKFNIIQKDTRPPEITDVQITTITQTTVDFRFVCSDIATAYIMIALKGTEKPTWDELKSQGPPEYETTESRYKIVQVGKELQGVSMFDALTAETEYVIFIFLEDRGGNQIEAHGAEEFKTSNRYDAAFMDLRFRQTYINSAERLLITKRVAFLLSLLPEKVEEKKYNFEVSLAPGLARLRRRRRELQTEVVASELDELTSKMTVTVLADPKSAVYPAPIELAKLMNRQDKKDKMAQTFSNFDKDFTLTPYNFTRYAVGFSAIPRIVDIGFSEINMTLNLDNFGFIYVVCIPKSDDLGKPSPFQISRGLDYRNIPLPSGSVEINQKFVLFNLTVGDLDADTDYNLYATAGSAHPGYPDLMVDNRTVFLEFKTQKAPIVPKLSLEFSERLRTWFVLIGVGFGLWVMGLE